MKYLLLLLLLVYEFSLAEDNVKNWCGLYYYREGFSNFVSQDLDHSWLAGSVSTIKELKHFMRFNGLSKNLSPAYLEFSGIKTKNTENSYHENMYIIYDLKTITLLANADNKCWE